MGPVAAPRATYLDAAALLKFEKRITENRQEIVNFKNEFVNQLESIIKNGMEALQQQQKLLDEVKLYLTKEGMAVASTDMIAIDDSVTEKLIKRAKHSISVFRDDLTDELLQAESLGINLERSVVKYRRQRQRELGDML